MAVLAETDELILLREYETALLKSKITGDVLMSHELYGDADCAVIDAQNRWAVVAGEQLVVWKDREATPLDHPAI